MPKLSANQRNRLETFIEGSTVGLDQLDAHIAHEINLKTMNLKFEVENTIDEILSERLRVMRYDKNDRKIEGLLYAEERLGELLEVFVDEE